jgi:hypothetical protein
VRTSHLQGISGKRPATGIRITDLSQKTDLSTASHGLEACLNSGQRNDGQFCSARSQATYKDSLTKMARKVDLAFPS